MKTIYLVTNNCWYVQKNLFCSCFVSIETVLVNTRKCGDVRACLTTTSVCNKQKCSTRIWSNFISTVLIKIWIVAQIRPLINTLTNLSSLPFCLYCCFPLVLNLHAAILRLHFWRQTGLKPGWSVTHFREVFGGKSCWTRSVSRDCPQPSNSVQQ